MKRVLSIILFLSFIFLSSYSIAQNFSLNITASPESVCSENETQIKAIPITSGKQITKATSTQASRPTVTITFASPVSETDFAITKADLKYNKDFAYSIQIDDGLLDIYTKAFPVLEGGIVDGTTYPGLTYTDGCGNPINFKMSTAHFSWNMFNNNSMHDPDHGYTGTLTWEQMIDLYQHNWGIYNHGFYDNGAEGGLSYDVVRNHSFTIRNTYNSILGGIQMKGFVIPGSNIALADYALDSDYHLILSNNYSYGSHNIDINEDEYYDIKVSRQNIDEVGIESTVDILSAESINGTHKWTTGFCHNIGSSYSISFEDFAEEASNVEQKYGSSGEDNLWWAIGEEVQDYLYVRNHISVNTEINNNTVTLTFSGLLPSDFRFYALSLLVDSDKEISNIAITDGFNNSYNLNYNNKALINLNWEERINTSAEDLSEEAVSIVEESLNKYDALIATDYIEIIEDADIKNYYKSRLCATGVELPEGYCDGIDNYTYSWSKNGSFFSDLPCITDTPSNTSTYSVIVSNQDNQTAEAQVTVEVVQAPEVEAGTSEEVCSNVPFQLSATANNYSSIIWESRGDGIFNNNTLISPTYSIGEEDIENGSAWLICHALSNGCEPTSDSIKVTFLPSPVIETPLENNICEDQWYSPEISIENATSVVWQTQGDGSFTNPNIANTTYIPGNNDIDTGETTLTMTAFSGEPCSYSVSKEISLSYSPSPTVIAGNDTSICYSTSSITLSGVANNSSSSLWSTTGTGTFSNNGLTATYIITEADKEAGELQFYITSQANTPCTTSAIDSLTVNILPEPFAHAGNDTLVCGEIQTQLHGSANNYGSVLWTTSGDGSFNNPNSLNSIYLPGDTDKAALSVVLTIHALSPSGCSDENTDNLTLTFPEQPTFSAGEDIDMCSTEDSVQLQSTITNASNFYWITQGDGSFNDTTIDNPVYYIGEDELNNGAAFVGLKVASNSPCNNDITDYLKINIFNSPTIEAGNDTILCYGAAFVPNAYALNYDSLFWTTTGDGVFSNTENIITTYYPGVQDESNNYVKLFLRAISHSGCDEEAIDSVSLSFDYPAIINAGSDQTICENTSYIWLQGEANNYSSVHWMSNGDGLFSDQDIINPRYLPGTQDIQNGVVEITMHIESNTGCQATLNDTMILNIIATPYAFAGNNDTICSDENIILNGDVANESSFLWSTLGDGTFNSTTILSPIYTLGEEDLLNGDVRLKLTAVPDAPCTATYVDFVDYHINNAPQIDINVDTAYIVEGETYSPQCNGAYYSTLQWLTSGSGYFSPFNSINTVYTPSNQDIYSGSAILTLIAHPQNNCANITTDNVLLIIEPLPEIYAGNDISSCESEISVELQGSFEGNEDIIWTTSGNGYFDNANNINTIYYFGTQDYSSGYVTITLSAQDDPDIINDELIITINNTPTVNAGNNGTSCGSTPYTLSPQVSNYSQLLWTTNGDGIFNDATIANAIYTAGQQDITQGDVQLTICASPLSGCNNNVTDNILLSIDPTPYANAGEDIEVCSLDEAINITDASADNASSISWETSGTGTFNNSNTLNTIYYPTDEDTDNGEITLTLTAYGNNYCTTSHYDNKIISFIEHAEVDIIYTENSCNGAPVNIVASANDYSLIEWISDGDGEFSSTNELTTIYTPGINDITNGNITLYVVASGNNQCENYSDTSYQTIEIVPMPTIDAGQDIETCETNSVILQGEGENYSSVLWTTIGDGYFSYIHNIETIYIPGEQDLEIGAVELTLTAYAENNCNDSVYDNILITFGSSPAIPDTPQGDTTVCQGTLSSVYTTNNISGATMYQWQVIPEDKAYYTETTTLPTNTINWFANSTGAYQVRVLATNNCGDSYYSNFLHGIIHPKPSVHILASPDTIVCNNQTITLDATTPLASSYLWLPGNEETAIITVDSSDNNNGIIFKKAVFTDIYGCTNSDSINIYFTECTNITNHSDNRITISPNPANNYINIKSDNNIYKADISILSNTGEKIYSYTNKTILYNTPLQINTKSYSSGIYFIEIKTMEDTHILKFIIIK